MRAIAAMREAIQAIEKAHECAPTATIGLLAAILDENLPDPPSPHVKGMENPAAQMKLEAEMWAEHATSIELEVWAATLVAALGREDQGKAMYGKSRKRLAKAAWDAMTSEERAAFAAWAERNP
ncbi:MAG: hypothetical protein MJH10_10220 [Epibacterium sp.]|nr:hypothetical protein [Epibacterium sp.]NQX73914.1 hypothetical protein [Epibacterium sp.]